MQVQEIANKMEVGFNLAELRDLAFKLNIEFEDLDGSTRQDKIRELIKYCERRKRLGELIYLLKSLRPNDTWEIMHSSKDTDLEIIRQHRIIFDRPLFSVSCIDELGLAEFVEGIDDTIAALNTGRLYSRSGNLLGEFPPRSAYRSSEFKETFSFIKNELIKLKRTVTEFETYFKEINPGYSHHQNFFAMLMGFWRDPGRGFFSEDQRGDTPKPNKQVIRKLVSFMDQLDILRNNVLIKLNPLLKESGENAFTLIEL